MPNYNRLRWKIKNPEERKRAVDNLISLREQLDSAVPDGLTLARKR